MPLSLNNAYPTLRSGRRVCSSALNTWKMEFNKWWLLNKSIIENEKKTLQIDSNNNSIHIACTFYFHYHSVRCKNGQAKKLDTSNYLKPLHDAISRAIEIDDRYFRSGSYLTKITPKTYEYVDVELTKNIIND